MKGRVFGPVCVLGALLLGAATVQVGQPVTSNNKLVNLQAGAIARAEDVMGNFRILEQRLLELEATCPNPTVSLVWKDAQSIEVQPGAYCVGGRVRRLTDALRWTWLPSGQNAGLIEAAPKPSTWYYLYGTLVNDELGVVASERSPTARRDSKLDGHARNVYLGAFFYSAASTIHKFAQNGARTLFFGSVGGVSTRSTQPERLVVQLPRTAGVVYGRIKAETTGDSGKLGVVAGDSSPQKVLVVATQVAGIGCHESLQVPIETPGVIYLHANNAATQVDFSVTGFEDRWL